MSLTESVQKFGIAASAAQQKPRLKSQFQEIPKVSDIGLQVRQTQYRTETRATGSISDDMEN